MLVVAESIAKTDTGRQRRGNEDDMLARAPVFVVADGMGGARAGEVAARIATDAFRQGLPEAGSPEERLAARAREANARIYELSISEHERAGMGTTLTAAYLDDGQLAIAHVGDSRAYLLRDGSLVRLTKDHSLVQALVDTEQLTEEQAAEHPQRSIITRALGPEPTVEIDTQTYPVKDGDILLLCSDGLTSMVSEERVTEIVAGADTLAAAAQELIDEANEAGGRDNITVILVRLQEVGPDVDPPSADATVAGAPAPGGRPRRASRAALRHPRARVPLARTQGWPEDRRAEAGRRRYFRALAALAAALIVLFVIGAAGYLASRQLYFIGTNPQGIVTIYRGLPYDLPAGIHLYETYYVSGVPAALVPPDRRAVVFNNQLRSQSDAQSLVHDLELGQLIK
jgi:protein phosphatase